MKTNFLFLLLQFLPCLLFGQLKGRVFDSETREPLPYAAVTAGSNKTLTDVNGEFSVAEELQGAKKVQLHIYHSFYKDTILLAEPAQLLHIYLQPYASSLQEVEIVAAPEKATPATEIKLLSRQELEAIGTPLGAPDLLRALQGTPGVLQTGETKSGLFVRGGTGAQTAMLMQGIPVFNAAHLLGINSSIDPDACNSVSFAKSGFAASQDGWLSAYVLTEPRALGVSGNKLKLGLGLLSSELSYQHYEPRLKTAVYSKLKSSYYQLLAKLYQELNGDEEAANALPDYGFNDVNLQIATALPKGRLSVVLFGSQDRYNASKELLSLKSGWGNRLVSVRWKHKLGGSSWLELTQGYSQYSFSMQHKRQEQDETNQTSRGYFTNVLITTPIHKSVVLETGLFIHALQTQSLSIKHDAENRLLKRNELQERLFATGVFGQAYLEKGAFSYAAGSRLYRQGNSFLWAPRLKMQLNKPKWGSPGLYYDRTFQFHHQVNLLGVSVPFDFLRLASRELPTQQADQLGLGINKSLQRYRFSASVYHRWLNGQLYYPNGNAVLSSSNKYFQSRRGRSYGLETEFGAEWNRLKLTVGYTLAYSKIALDDQPGGRVWVHPAQDVRHQLNTGFSYALGRRWQLMAQWFLQSGSPYTFPVGVLPAQGMYPQARANVVPQFQEFNNIRTPSSHRLDISATYRKKLKRGYGEWNFGVYNVYNQANPYFLYFDVLQQEDGTARVITKQKSLLPFTPTIRYTWTLDL